MKIKSINLENFANIQEFTANLGSGVNFITASNGRGKTTVGITAVWACLKGIAERGDVLKGKRSVWVGKYGNDAEITIILTDPDGVDYTVNRKISENKLEITRADGKKLDQTWLNTFWNDLMLSPIAFSRLSAKEQAVHLGIDTSDFDEEITTLKEDASFLRRTIKDFGEVEVPEKVESVDVAELSKEKDALIRWNQEQDRTERVKAEISAKINFWKEKREEYARLEREATDKISELVDELSHAPVVMSRLATTEIDQKISAASEINARAIAYENALKRREEKSAKELELAENITSQKYVESQKVAYMQSLDLPFSNLTIDENGGLQMDGRPLKAPEFSKGELIKITTMLLSSRNPDWNYVFLEEFDLLDSQKSKEVLDWLSEKDFQVLAEKVVDEQENVIILQDLSTTH
jgi:hypothetical protein